MLTVLGSTKVLGAVNVSGSVVVGTKKATKKLV